MRAAQSSREREYTRREEIIAATYRAFVDKGFYDVTLQDISEYAGFSKGVTMYYFKSKEEVFQALLEWLVTKIAERMTTSVAEHFSAMDKLNALIDSVFLGARENREFYLVYLDYLSLGSRRHLFGSTHANFYEQCRELGRHIVEQGIREGTFRSVDPSAAAAVVRALVDGLCIQWLFDSREDTFTIYKERCRAAAIAFLKA
jgi:AcrR family transcriptional regulator